jgi:hypothetical protein
MDPEKKRAITIRLSVLALILVTIISFIITGEKIIKNYLIIGAYLLLLSIIALYFYVKDDSFNLKTLKLCLIWNTSIIVILSILTLLIVLSIIGGVGLQRY